MRVGTRFREVWRGSVTGDVTLRMNEATAAELADIIEHYEERRHIHGEPVTLSGLVGDLRTAGR